MELTKLSDSDLRGLKVGDVVIVQNGFAGEIVPPKAIIAVEPRFGTDVLPLITLEGHDPNWAVGTTAVVRFENNLQFDAHWVQEVVSRALFVSILRPRCNKFADYVTQKMANGRYWNYPRSGAPKGQLCGRYRQMDELFIWALAKLPYELTTALHEERAMQLWKQAGYPGLVRAPDPISDDGDRRGRHFLDLLQANEHYFVREKPFLRFVRQNWSRFVMTKAEMDKQEDDYLDWRSGSAAREEKDERAFLEANEPNYEDDNGGWPVD